MERKWIHLLVATGMLLGWALPGEVSGKEKEFPSKAIELIVPWGAGGSTSMGARVIAGTLSEILRTPVVVINKTGGGGSVAAAYVARSKPDGYTLIIANSASNGIMLAIRSTGYKNSDFEPLVQYSKEDMALVVKSDSPWKGLADLVAEAKKEPGKLKYASAGVGTSSHCAMELLKIAAGGLKIDHVPFKSSPEIVAAILGGHVHVSMMNMVGCKEPAKAGRLRILAIPAEKRLEEFPEVPTFAELGLPEVKWTAWYGIAAPAGLPRDVSAKLRAALYKTIKHPDVTKMLAHIGYMPEFREAEEFARFIAEEEKKFQKVAREANIRVE